MIKDSLFDLTKKKRIAYLKFQYQNLSPLFQIFSIISVTYFLSPNSLACNFFLISQVTFVPLYFQLKSISYL